MPTPDTPFYDVIIAGGGPVGLFLACELRLGGCTVLVLEKAQDPRSPLKELPFGLRGLTVPTIESFDRRGLLDDLKARAASRDIPAAAHWMKQTRRAGGHFAGIQFFHDQIDTSRWAHHLPGPVSSVAADMASIEAVLTERADALGVEITRGFAVNAVDSSSEDVTVHAGGNVFRGRWLVGCDGGRSSVRKAAGFAFAGTDPEFTGYSVVVELSDPAALRPGRHYTSTGMYICRAGHDRDGRF
jgi:2-polyprenyl-6-methoxyphenol hydroxylase-like FAD-dependent oxidoreductase